MQHRCRTYTWCHQGHACASTAYTYTHYHSRPPSLAATQLCQHQAQQSYPPRTPSLTLHVYNWERATRVLTHYLNDETTIHTMTMLNNITRTMTSTVKNISCCGHAICSSSLIH